MRVNTDREFRIRQLQEELTGALGRPVSLSTRRPGQVGEDGKPLPGVVVVLDGGTGEPLLNKPADRKKVERVLAEHTPAEPTRPPSADEELVQALQGATTVTALKDALLAYHGAKAERALEHLALRAEGRRGRR